MIVLPESLLSAWEGNDPPSGGRQVEATFRCGPDGPATDYDRACSSDEAVAQIPVGGGSGIVIASAPLLTWVGSRFGGHLVVAHAWDDLRDDSGTQVVSEVPATSYGPPSFFFENPDDRMFVLAAADRFANEYGYGTLKISLRRGRYLVSTAQFEPRPTWSFSLHQFVRATA
jgi:hypothetical protein